jgi:diguanylate cyclase (GGDEF)-like protein/PAS domain S-box-containing protein
LHSVRNLITVRCVARILALVALCAPALAFRAIPAFASPASLNTVNEVRRFQGSVSGAPIPVHVRGVVTYYDSVVPNLFVQDATGGVWVDVRGLHQVLPRVGQSVDMQGVVGLGFTPYIAKPRWKALGTAPFPKPIRLSYEKAATGSYDSQWVEMEGIVLSFTRELEGSVLVIDVATPAGSFRVRVPGYTAPFPMQFVDAKVRFRGVCASAFNQRNQLLGIHLMMPGLENAAVVQPAAADPFSMPVTPVSSIGRFSAVLTEIHRVKVRGIVTARYPQRGAFLMDSTGGLYAESKDGTPAEAGDEVEIVGFPAAGTYSPVLKSASIRPTGRHQAIAPFALNGHTALKGAHDAQLVTISGTLQAVTPHRRGYSLVLQSEDKVAFESSFSDSLLNYPAPPIGSRLKLTGICSVKTDANGNPSAFEIVLRRPEDIVVVSSPPWLTSRRAAYILALLLFLTAAIMGWVVILRMRVKKQTQLIKSRMQAEIDLEARYRRMFERNLTGLYVAAPDGAILDCNNTFAQILGYGDRTALLENSKQAEALTTQFHEHLFESQESSINQILNAEHRFQRHDGSWRWVLTNIRLVSHAENAPPSIEGGLVDITDRKLAEEQIQFLAYYDSLTQLPNRGLLKDRLAQALASARRHKEKVAILFLDLDRFKDINDSLGHSFGDLLLQQVAQRLRTLSRDEDTVARIGGDEFLILLNSLQSVKDASASAERILLEMERDFVIQGQTFKVGCSIGISVFPEHGEDGETLIKNADAAMYNAKESGRHASRFFTEDMNAELVARLTTENNLRLALERDEFFLVYQPQMEMETGRIVGLEALLRWRQPELGLVMPYSFIPVAESCGLIVPIGEWVLRTACAQARKWRDAGLDVQAVAVNVSAVQFRQEGFCAMVKAALSDTGLEPQCLELELTESSLFSNVDVHFSQFEQLKRMGVKLAIDDFGTGYSSLSYLRQFPVTRLKIDRSFIQDVAINPDDAAITTAIIDMAKALSLKVIAEGVETEAQMAFLRAHRCDQIQGYFFSKPLTVENLEKDKILKPAVL